MPVRVPVSVDPFGKPDGCIEADPEIAGQWDQRQWRPHP